MNADEVRSELKAHEEKCDTRQDRVYAKFDSIGQRIDSVDKDVRRVEKIVYVGVGILIAFDVFLVMMVEPILQLLIDAPK